MKNENPGGVFWRIALISLVLLFVTNGAVIAADKPEVPVINGAIGSCSADFTVTDSEKKPIFNAKIHVIIHYGLLGIKRMELRVGTDSDGKARVIGLPEKTKKPLEFDISSGDLSKAVLVDPTAECKSTIEVVLGAK